MAVAWLWSAVWLLGTCVCSGAITQSTSTKDGKTYLFAYGASFKPFHYLNQDGELTGFSYNLVLSVCKVMNKNCAHTVFSNYSHCWDDAKKSDGLNNRWWDVCVGYVPTQVRRQVYGFLGQYAREPEAYLYVRYLSGIHFGKVGFHSGWWLSPSCLEKYVGRSLEGNSHFYASYEEMANALHRKELDSMFVSGNMASGDRRFVRVWKVPASCSPEGPAMMMRRDMLQRLLWFSEGLQKLRQNGDYNWLCNIAEKDGDPRCL